jgi:hypothetical protein
MSFEHCYEQIKLNQGEEVADQFGESHEDGIFHGHSAAGLMRIEAELKEILKRKPFDKNEDDDEIEEYLEDLENYLDSENK